MTSCRETSKETNKPKHDKALKLGFFLRRSVLAF